MGVARGHSVSSLVRGYSLVRGFAFRGSTVVTTVLLYISLVVIEVIVNNSI